ncbi:SDR family oxidoreductase [Mesorhizobium sp. LHD-90]|uniref:SDR family oxidoreductase n=1 Tax=Mesorhizobium sp. LHD-90 TaxID=3071414 RepID=UPI0027E0292B|nr:SDR family NAD(P)-dependent oxidoreductase [Mesorhizobium sp. LHD-90]MDQ6438064.1 SDR family oxidoreductase [Mesorhizobium sp. LHD-90]
MSEPLPGPKRKNPLARTQQPLLPPAIRSRAAHGLTLAAAEGRFAIQRCAACNSFAYPPRDACPHCLSDRLPFVEAPSSGVLAALTTIQVSGDSYFRERMPWRTGIVTMDCGPQVIAHVHGDCIEGEPVRLSLQLDRSGHAVMFANPVSRTPDMQDDLQWREMAADPRDRRILISDGRNPVGQALARSLVRAGARTVFVGVADRWKPFPAEQSLRELAGVEIVPLEMTDERSVADLAADIGAKVDILVNTADHIRPGHIFDGATTLHMADAMNATLFGTMRLARAFAPVMIARGADGHHGAAAWVNILSVYALANLPAMGSLSVSHAACLSLSHWLRTELAQGGVKLLNAFAGPLDTEWFQALPPPKLAPAVLADAVVDGLRRGIEEVYVGDVANDITARLAANPKALEREIGQ